MRKDKPHDLKLHERLPKAERGEDSAAASAHCPAHDVALKIKENVAHLVFGVEPARNRQDALVLQKLLIVQLDHLSKNHAPAILFQRLVPWEGIVR